MSVNPLEKQKIRALKQILLLTDQSVERSPLSVNVSFSIRPLANLHIQRVVANFTPKKISINFINSIWDTKTTSEGRFDFHYQSDI